MHHAINGFPQNVFNFPEISTSEAPLSLPASIDSTSSVDSSSIISDAPSSSESIISSTTLSSLPSTTEEIESTEIDSTTLIVEDVVDTSTPSTKITAIVGQSVGNDRDPIETTMKSESIASSPSSTINIEVTTSRSEEMSHREHGRALNLTNVASAVPARAKALNDLSDVSMDDDNFGDGNAAKEEMMIAQTQHKECESKVRERKRDEEKQIFFFGNRCDKL